MKRLIKKLVIAFISMGVLLYVAMILIVISIRPSKVDAAQAEACRHYNNQTIMAKVILAKTEDQSEWKNFSYVQDTAEKNGILIDFGQITFGNDIWLVPFTQRIDQSGIMKYFGMLDCTTDNVEFSKT